MGIRENYLPCHYCGQTPAEQGREIHPVSRDASGALVACCLLPECVAKNRVDLRPKGTPLNCLKRAVQDIENAVRLLAQNSILGDSMKDERKSLSRLGLRFADVVHLYENPPPLPPGASTVCVRDDSPYRKAHGEGGGELPNLNRVITGDPNAKEPPRKPTPEAK